ncbi:STAS domain-containing protein [Baia soyae]|uniref:STAS domain-containing protein n=1 Tax=Baia soyae TaxID=1544746 RepID=A0A4R2RUU6_9BACL|nr:STAS domain-containing protein [Baia soyae]
MSIGTFDWNSFSYLKRAPKSDAIVMLVTVAIVVYTHDLSKGVIAGVILSAIFFVSKISKMKVTKQQSDSDIQYTAEGQLFFASVESFLQSFDLTVQQAHIVIDFADSHVWDDSAVGAIDRVVIKLRENQNTVEIRNLNVPSKRLVDKLAVSNDASAKLSTH